MNHSGHDTTVAWYRRPAVLGLSAIGGFFAVYLAAQNWEQAAPYLPWLLILAIPLLHVFMHRGHGAHGGTGAHGGMGGIGGCGGHGSHGGGHQHREGAGREHDHERTPPAEVAGKATEGAGRGGCCGGHGTPADGDQDTRQSEPGGGCCGGASQAHDDEPAAGTHAQGGDCCGGQGDKPAEKSDDQPQRGHERR